MTPIHDENDRSAESDGNREARLPDFEQADVTHYAYDPQTYEILCRPGQPLTRKKAQRLQELNLYAHVVAFTE